MLGEEGEETREARTKVWRHKRDSCLIAVCAVISGKVLSSPAGWQTSTRSCARDVSGSELAARQTTEQGLAASPPHARKSVAQRRCIILATHNLQEHRVRRKGQQKY